MKYPGYGPILFGGAWLSTVAVDICFSGIAMIIDDEMRERGDDLTIFSPRASFMAHHIGEFIAAIREGREPKASIAQVLPCYRVLHQLEQQLS